AITVPGISSSNFAVASAPDKSLQSAMSPAPTMTMASFWLAPRKWAFGVFAQYDKPKIVTKPSTMEPNLLITTASELKFNSQHELYLPGQACPSIWRRRIVIVSIEIIRRGDHPKIRFGSQKIIVGYEISVGIDALGEVERQVIGI